MKIEDLTNCEIMDEMMRQFPIWPSTFGACINHGDGEDHVSARGSRFCLLCLQREWERRTDGKDDDLYEFTNELEKVHDLYHSLLKKLKGGA